MGIKRDLTRRQRKEMRAAQKGSYQLIRDTLMALLARGYTHEQIAVVLKKSERQIARYRTILREEFSGTEFVSKVEDQLLCAKKQAMEIALTQLNEMCRNKTNDNGQVIKAAAEPAEIIKSCLATQRVISEYEELCARIGVLNPRDKPEKQFPALKLVMLDAEESREDVKDPPTGSSE